MTLTPVGQTTEIWFSVECSRKGANDWFKMSQSTDTLESAKTVKTQWEKRTSIGPVEYEYRIVRNELTTTVLEGL